MYFCFQAEDGIRGGHVTGVQTCALPISCCTSLPTPLPPGAARLVGGPEAEYGGGRCPGMGRSRPRITAGGRRSRRDRKSVVEGEREDLGDGRITKRLNEVGRCSIAYVEK